MSATRPVPSPRSHRLLPAILCNAVEALGWWQNPVPQPTVHARLVTVHQVSAIVQNPKSEKTA